MHNRGSDDQPRNWPFVLLIAAILIGFLISLLPLRAAAHDHWTYHAEFYSEWLTREGISCCSGKDCEPIDDKNVRLRSEGVEVYVEGEWVPVTPEQVRPYQAPDLMSHLCHLGTIVFCFVFGGGA